MKIPVTYAKLSCDAFIPGIGGLGSTLPSNSKTVRLSMYLDSEVNPNLLFLEVNGLQGFIPLSKVDIATMVVEKHAEKPKDKEEKVTTYYNTNG